MFFNRSNKELQDKVDKAKYERLMSCLQSILKTEVKVATSDGKEEVDYVETCRVIKSKARLTIDFVNDLDKEDNK